MATGGLQEDACEIDGLRIECGLRALQVEQLTDKIAQLRKQYDDEVIRHSEECEALKAENAKLKEEYGEATDTIQGMIDILKDTEKRLAKSNCPHALAAGAWIAQALEE
jgi:predicted RNase H-like nuclease (RuvC/YqgF family)